jgi:transcriptional regulator with XRE-family HTH domain
MYDIAESGKRLKKLRKRKGKTQEQVAEEVQIALKTYQAVEQGQRGGSVDTLLLLSGYFGVSLDFLVKGEMENTWEDSFSKAIRRMDLEQQHMLQQMLESTIQILGW